MQVPSSAPSPRLNFRPCRACDDNDGLKPFASLPEIIFQSATNPVVQLADEKSGEILFSIHVAGSRLQPPVFSAGTFNVQIGRNRPVAPKLSGLSGRQREAEVQRTIAIPG